MADNIPVTPGSGKVVATDEVTDGVLGTAQVQFVKLMDGTLESTNKLIISSGGAAKVDGSAVTQPVSGSISVSNFPATQPVSGTIAVSNFPVTQPISAASLPLPTGASTEATLSALNAKVTAVNTGAVTISAALPAGTNVIGHVIVDSAPTTTVTGTVAVSNFPASQPVTGTFFQATQPVSIATMPTTPVTGTFFQATQPVSGTVAVSSVGGSVAVTGPLTDAQLRATPVPISGTVTATTGGLTDTQLRASPVPISGTVTATPTGTQDVNIVSTVSVPVTGVFFQATQPVSGNVGILAANLTVTATGASAAAVTATLPAVAGQFHYITGFEIEAYTILARTGSATPVIVTSTNLQGNNAWTFASAAAIGTTDTKWYQTCSPIKSAVANTNTTIVCPATTSIIWRVNVYYYTAA